MIDRPQPHLRVVDEMTGQELVELHRRLSATPPCLGMHVVASPLQPDDDDAAMPPAA